MSYKGTPVYLRDLGPNEQRELIRDIRAEGKADLVCAMENDEDIIVGYYLPYNEIQVAK